MKDEKIQELITRIHQEFDEIKIVIKRIKEGWERTRRLSDDYYLDGVALNLHGFYMGSEQIFANIAESVDGYLPRGESWHLLLLQQMMTEIPSIRPPVITVETGTKLDEYRRFRHMIRNVYTFNFDPVKIGKLVADAPSLFEQLKAEVSAFTDFLEQA
ncbi:MAG: hypothetical protein HND47_07010 [Chloroflexi bacterium]|nr:hypothetical protein [Chloroflexota bacterium]